MLNLDWRGGPGYIRMSGNCPFSLSLSRVGRIGILQNPTLRLFFFSVYFLF